MIILNNVLLPLDTDFSNIKPIIAANIKTDISNILSAELYKKSVDARKKNNVCFCCSFKVQLEKYENKIIEKNKNVGRFEQKAYTWKKAQNIPTNRPIIVGFGPAGMFAALTLARAGLKPLVIERGSAVEQRTQKVKRFLNGGPLDTESNVQFGEGGAGTFSDGKLNTGIKNVRCRTVLEVFNKHGAPDRILTDAKPHIGTDILVSVVKSIRKEIISLGGEIRFDTKLESIKLQDGRVTSILANQIEIPCDKLVLAIGHSARDTYEMLKETGIQMTKKPFAMGVRIEHLQKDINSALYGDFAQSGYLGAADYKLWAHLPNGRGVYTFCMCPGGEVINASSENGGIAVNGMSNSKRNCQNANSALLVNVEPEDFGTDDVLAGCYLQRKVEQKAYSLFSGAVPITTVGAFLNGEEAKIGKIKPTVKPSYCFADLSRIFPEFITESLKEGIKLFDKKINGFANGDAIITAPESRSSSPVRILRNDDFESLSVKGIYPCGEGAGYAGGIMSAAVDGMSVAEKIIE